MTNYEKIKEMSVDEMAKYLTNIIDGYTEPCDICGIEEPAKRCKPENRCEDCVQKWLESEDKYTEAQATTLCKVGDKVYQRAGGWRVVESKIVDFYYDKDYKKIVYLCDAGLAFSEEAIGESIYLTREKAEIAAEEYLSNG